MGLGELICQEAIAHYKALQQKGKPSPNQWTVLSAIILERPSKSAETSQPEPDLTVITMATEPAPDLTVITMATGTKCVGEELKGPYTVSDSHAEVLALRLFRLWLIKELLKGDGEVLRTDQAGKFKLKSGLKFHFYSSCVPCGDATIGADESGTPKTEPPPSTESNGNEHLKRPPSPENHETKHPKIDPSIIRTGAKCLSDDPSIMRTGAKCLSDDHGNLKSRTWHRTSVLRTKPGRGPICLSLSCSDKLMKRQYLGLEGGLLARFISDPIRFSSFTVGGDFAVENLKRALFDRVPDSMVPDAGLYKVRDMFQNSLENCKADKVPGQVPTNVPGQPPSKVPASSTCLLWTGGKQWVGIRGRVQGATKTSSPHKVMLPVCRAALFELTKDIPRDKDIPRVNRIPRDNDIPRDNAEDCPENIYKNGNTASSDIDHILVNPERNTKVPHTTSPTFQEFNRVYRDFKSHSSYAHRKSLLSSYFDGWSRKCN